MWVVQSWIFYALLGIAVSNIFIIFSILKLNKQIMGFLNVDLKAIQTDEEANATKAELEAKINSAVQTVIDSLPSLIASNIANNQGIADNVALVQEIKAVLETAFPAAPTETPTEG